MIWKPKEKELSEEEAISLAKKDLMPYWYKSTPLVTGIRTNGRTILLPLDSEFSKKAWIAILVDPTDFSGELAITYACEWQRRFHNLPVGMLMVLISPYEYLRESQAISHLIDKFQVKFPVVHDFDGALAEALRLKTLPKIVLVNSSSYAIEHEGRDWVDQVETEIQNFLRSTDPGLALLPEFHLPRRTENDFLRLEFGFSPKFGKARQFAEPGFLFSNGDQNNQNHGQNVGHSQEGKGKTGDKTNGNGNGNGNGQSGHKIGKASFNNGKILELEFGEVSLSGEWTQQYDKITTADSRAKLTLLNTGPSYFSRISMVAEAFTKIAETATVVVEIDQRPVFEGFAASSLLLDDNGNSEVRVRTANLYDLLANLSKEQKQVDLFFPNAEQVPISIYGLRVSGASG